MEERKEKEGFVCLRMPPEVRDQLEMNLSEMVSRCGNASEIRFVMIGDTAKIKLAKFDKENHQLYSYSIFYGGIQGTWQDDHRYLESDIDEIVKKIY